MSADVSIVHTDRLELAFAPKPWAFAIERRAEIDAHFAALQRDKPALWNGRVLMLHEHAIAVGVFRGAFLETDYASFIAWRHWGCPAAAVYDCFGAAAILTADGAFLVAVMGEHGANAGRIYFPCGSPDPGDIVDGKVDLDYSVRRELMEETGLDIREFAAEPGWTTVSDGPLIANVSCCARGKTPRAYVRAFSVTSPATRSRSSPTSASCAGAPTSIPRCPALLRHSWRSG
jgi:8-oxo-dGTP pyrophosphatase MutT (NUDIX family)